MISLFLSGDSIIDSVRSYRLHVFDPLSPSPSSSRESDSVSPFVCSLLGVPVSSFSLAVGDSDVRSSGVSGSSLRSFSVSLPVSSSLAPVASGFSFPFVLSSFPYAPSFAGSVAGAVPNPVI